MAGFGKVNATGGGDPFFISWLWDEGYPGTREKNEDVTLKTGPF